MPQASPSFSWLMPTSMRCMRDSRANVTVNVLRLFGRRPASHASGLWFRFPSLGTSIASRHALVLAMFMIWSRILKMTLIQQQS